MRPKYLRSTSCKCASFRAYTQLARASRVAERNSCTYHIHSSFSCTYTQKEEQQIPANDLSLPSHINNTRVYAQKNQLFHSPLWERNAGPLYCMACYSSPNVIRYPAILEATMWRSDIIRADLADLPVGGSLVIRGHSCLNQKLYQPGGEPRKLCASET